MAAAQGGVVKAECVLLHTTPFLCSFSAPLHWVSAKAKKRLNLQCFLCSLCLALMKHDNHEDSEDDDVDDDDDDDNDDALALGL